MKAVDMILLFLILELHNDIILYYSKHLSIIVHFCRGKTVINAEQLFKQTVFRSESAK